MTSDPWDDGDRWDPRNPDNRERTRLLRAELRSLLMEWWDPIGVRGVPEAQDEYDGYLVPVMRLLHQRATHEQLTTYLLEIANERMGLQSDGSREARTANELMRWWAASTD